MSSEILDFTDLVTWNEQSSSLRASQGLNPYAYALNAPTSHVDPDGHAIIDGVSFGAFSFGIVAQYDIQGRGPGQADQKFQIGWGGAHVPTASGYAKSIALGDAPIFSWGQPRWASPQLDPGDPDPGKVTTPNPDLRMTGGGLITFGALGFPEDAPLWLAGGLILGGWVLLNEGKSVEAIIHASSSRSNPFTGKPGSTSETKTKDGKTKQIRRYGPDGYPETDTDYDHDHGQGVPHVHDWGRSEGGGPPSNSDRGAGRVPETGDPGFE